jgi:hypothetical protein
MFNAFILAYMFSILRSSAIAIALLTSPVQAQTEWITEYYNHIIDHYFIAREKGDGVLVDSVGAPSGWMRTGQRFLANSAASGTLSPVCRFYAPPSVGANTHFFTAEPSECDLLKNPTFGLIYEGVEFYAERAISSGCSASLLPVWRAYNNRFGSQDSNHRYATNRALLEQLMPEGWTIETNAFCVPKTSPAASTNFTKLSFKRDYAPGYRDITAAFAGGTELNAFVFHNGKLYASVSYWKDAPGTDPAPGAQVLVKDSSNAAWRVDKSWGGRTYSVEALASIRFSTDAAGKRLPKPVVMLIASPNEAPGETGTIWSRNDDAGTWERTLSLPGDSGARVIFDHVDRVTGVHYVFAGMRPGKLYRGAYDPASPGRIAWQTVPELTAPSGERYLSAAVANGVVYVTSGGDYAKSQPGTLYKRVDGAHPIWIPVYTWPALAEGSDGMRGLTAIEYPLGSGKQVLLGAREKPGIIERIDPNDNYRAIVELDVRAYFTNLWGGLGGSASLIAYNDMTAAVDPDTGENVHLLGLWVNHPSRPNPPDNGSYYLTRRADGTYSHGNLYDAANPIPAGQELRATRTIVVSQFVEDQSRVIYFGGFDAGGAGDKHNSAWVYRGAWPGTTRPPTTGIPPSQPATELYEPAQKFGVNTFDGYVVNTSYGIGTNTYNWEIPVFVRYPIGASGKLPVVVWSHGGGKKVDGKSNNKDWGDALASAGYIVVHMSHMPRTSQQTASLETEFGMPRGSVNSIVEANIDRPRDAIAVLNDLTNIANAVPGLAGNVDLDRVAVAGHSRGAYTVRTTACARVNLPNNPDYSFVKPAPTNQPLKVQPKAFMANSPAGPGRFGFKEDSWRECTLPDLTQTGTGDDTEEQSEDRVKSYELMPPGNKYMMYIDDPNTPHDTFNLNNPSRADFENYVRTTGLAFLDAYVKQQPAARAYLTSRTLESLSQGKATISAK